MIKKIRKYLIFILLIISIIIIIILGIFHVKFFTQIINVSKLIWTGIITILTLLGFVVKGVLKKPPKSFVHFIDNAYVQIAILGLFVVISGLFVYIICQATIMIKPSIDYNSKIDAKMLWQENGKQKDSSITIPNTFYYIKPGPYIFKIKEGDRYFETDTSVNLRFRWGKPEALTLNILPKIGKIITSSNPTDAEIWLDGNPLNKKTPDTLNYLSFGKHELVLKKDRYKTVSITCNINSDCKIVKLHVMLVRIYRINFRCIIDDINFSINGRIYKGDQENVPLPEGSYQIESWTNSDTYPTQYIDINNDDMTIIVPKPPS